MSPVVLKIKASKKYRYLPLETIERIVNWASLRHNKTKEIDKAARQQLHQVFGAYLDQLDFELLAKQLLCVDPELPLESLKAHCLIMMANHTSTRERQADFAQVYAWVFGETGPINQVLDLACGLNSLSWPWLSPFVQSYWGIDLDTRLQALCTQFFQKLGINGEVFSADLLLLTEFKPVDMVFLLKTLPCLEQQEKGSSIRLLNQLHADWLLLSFPHQTLSGKSKGMAENYRNALEALLPQTFWRLHDVLDTGTEGYYLCQPH